LLLAVGWGGCGLDSSPTPLTPSSLPLQSVVPAPTAGVFPPGTLTGVSLSGVVYELTPIGRKPIARALVCCELCGSETHTFATADDDGFYQFSGDLATNGGVWLAPGVPTAVSVGYNLDFEDRAGYRARADLAGERYRSTGTRDSTSSWYDAQQPLPDHTSGATPRDGVPTVTLHF
jgi:hypothetical protein